MSQCLREDKNIRIFISENKKVKLENRIEKIWTLLEKPAPKLETRIKRYEENPKDTYK